MLNRKKLVIGTIKVIGLIMFIPVMGIFLLGGIHVREWNRYYPVKTTPLDGEFRLGISPIMFGPSERNQRIIPALLFKHKENDKNAQIVIRTNKDERYGYEDKSHILIKEIWYKSDGNRINLPKQKNKTLYLHQDYAKYIEMTDSPITGDLIEIFISGDVIDKQGNKEVFTINREWKKHHSKTVDLGLWMGE